MLEFAGNVVRTEEARNAHRILIKKLLGMGNFEDQEGDKRLQLFGWETD